MGEQLRLQRSLQGSLIARNVRRLQQEDLLRKRNLSADRHSRWTATRMNTGGVV